MSTTSRINPRSADYVVGGTVDDDGIFYPESDGKPMAENTEQADVIVRNKVNFRVLFDDVPNVTVVGDLLWYPVKGEPRICRAPDLLVIADMDQHELQSYRPWEQGGRPTLVVEVLSQSNTERDVVAMHEFYERYGAEDLLVYDPKLRGKRWDRDLVRIGTPTIRAWERQGDQLVPVSTEGGWTSPSTGVRFTVEDDDLVAVDPTGKRWLNPAQSIREADQRAAAAEQRAARAEVEREALLAEVERLRRSLDTPD